MSIAKILVPLVGHVRDRSALKTAIAVGRIFGAHVAARFVHLDPKFAFAYSTVPLLPGEIAEVLTVAESAAAAAEKNTRLTVSDVLKEEGLVCTETAIKPGFVSCSFKVVTGLFQADILKAAELSDLIVFGPISTHDEPEVSEAFLDTLLKIRRPLLIAQEPPARLAQIAIGWDGSDVAARAVQAALPFLKCARHVDVITVRVGKRAPATDDLRDYLSLHEVPASYREIAKDTQPVAEILLKSAQLNGADMLVMGGYGHSYWLETLFGGVTAHVRWHATLPVLIAH